MFYSSNLTNQSSTATQTDSTLNNTVDKVIGIFKSKMETNFPEEYCPISRRGNTVVSLPTGFGKSRVFDELCGVSNKSTVIVVSLLLAFRWLLQLPWEFLLFT